MSNSNIMTKTISLQKESLAHAAKTKGEEKISKNIEIFNTFYITLSGKSINLKVSTGKANV